MMYLDKNWCGLHWSPWLNFVDKQFLSQIPSLPGVYRVKGKGQQRLYYIGQTGRTLKNRLRELVKTTYQEVMPFNDPHTAAPSLWAWRDAEDIEFEVSTASVNLEKRLREGLECYLLWQYRLEAGESTLCNHGRFHPSYKKSRNRSTSMRGYRLPAGEVNPAGGASVRPLVLQKKPSDNDWMGLQWSDADELKSKNMELVPKANGLYKLMGGEQLLYIGQTTNLRNRLISYLGKKWDGKLIKFSFHHIPEPLQPYQLKE